MKSEQDKHGRGGLFKANKISWRFYAEEPDAICAKPILFVDMPGLMMRL